MDMVVVEMKRKVQMRELLKEGLKELMAAWRERRGDRKDACKGE